jgi:ABC-type hemin transport system ATPase subunit
MEVSPNHPRISHKSRLGPGRPDTAAAGEILGFLGLNGAGKTTTIRLLMGMLRPSQGSARIFGLDSCGRRWRSSS